MRDNKKERELSLHIFAEWKDKFPYEKYLQM